MQPLNRDDREFQELIEKLLQNHNRHFQGIRLHCRNCGDTAIAGTVKLAELFGWCDLVQRQGPEYEGLCLSCQPPRMDAEKARPDTAK